jgi:protein phosphatase
MAETLHIELAAVTHRGMVRTENQDSIHASQIGEGRYLVAVADGVGGREGGAWASSRTLEVLVDQLSQPATPFTAAVSAANRAVFDEGARKTELHGAATTLVAVLVGGPSYSWVNVGDSRAYLLRGENFDQLTTDHSLVEEEIAAGRITREQAAKASYRNVITRSIGHRPSIQVDHDGPFPLQPGDQVLLCSDGLHGLVSNDEIERHLREMAPQQAADNLLALANARGGQDNISIVILAAHATGAADSGQRNGKPAQRAAEQETVRRAIDSGMPSIRFVALCILGGATVGLIAGLRLI